MLRFNTALHPRSCLNVKEWSGVTKEGNTRWFYVNDEDTNFHWYFQQSKHDAVRHDANDGQVLNSTIPPIRSSVRVGCYPVCLVAIS